MAKSGEIIARQGTSELPAGAGTQRQRLLRKLALLAPFVLLLVYFAKGAQEVQAVGGIEGMVRNADFMSTLTGALVIRQGHGPSLYNLETQRDAQNQVLGSYNHVDLGSMLPYNHLPFEALAITPLINLPYPLIFGLWTLLMALAVGLSLKIMQSALPMPREVAL